MKIENKNWIITAKGFAVFLLIFFFSAFWAACQQTGQNENDVILNAQALFDKKDYQAALPLYAQLVSVHPDDPQFNYKFGVCTLLGDRKDKKKPIKYLSNAAQTINDDKELLYYLGLAYHQNQDWSNAMKYFNLYLSKLTPNAPDRAAVLEKVNACLNGLNLANKNLISEIISTSKFQKNNFHRAYAANDFNGSLMIKPDIFVTEKERKSGTTSYVYLIQPSNVLYFSGYTNSENSNKDIFVVMMDDNGDWGIPERLNESINTPFDEDYPVLVDNGNTLYFCSKGHNSLGGFDIFRATLDPESNTFKNPENLGPGINSPFDDIVFIPTKDKSYAYFSSDRDNLNGSINVYKVKLIDNAFNEEFVAGNYSVETNKKAESEGNKERSGGAIDLGNEAQITLQQNTVIEPFSDPSRKANNMANDKARCMALADSAFAIIANTKNLVRDITNKRDRANAISQRKADEAKTLEMRLNESIAQLVNAENEEMFLQELSKSIQIKEDLYQLQQRSNLSNKIAWNLGNQIKMKNQELNDLKTLAGKIQSAAVSSTYEETFLQFSKYKNIVKAADTITDYSETLMAITNNKTSWKVPESELLFAENLKKAYKDKTLYAELGNKKPEFDESIPIVIVDKRSNIQDNNLAIAEKQKLFNPLPLVEQVSFSEKNIASLLPGKESLELSFTIDNRMEAYSLVQPVNASALKSHNDLANNNLNIDFEVDKAEAIKLVEPVKMNLVAQNADLASEKLEISYINDNRMDALAQVQPVYASDLISHNDLANNNLNIDFEVDKAEAAKLVEPVKMNLVAKNAEVANEKPEINVNADNKVESIALVQPVYISGQKSQIDLANNNLIIDFKADRVEALKLVEPVKMNLLAKSDKFSNENLEISNYFEKPAILNSYAIIDPVYSNIMTAFNYESEAMEISFSADAVDPIVIVEPVTFATFEQQEIFGNEDIVTGNIPEEKPLLLASKTIEPVTFVAKSTNLSNQNEKLDIDFKLDQARVEKIVEQVEPYSIASIQVNESDIELNFGVDKSVAFTLIQPLEIKDFSKYVQTPAADELEINYDVDLVDFRTYELVQSVDYQPISSPLTGILPIEISFINEPAVNTFDIIEPVTYSMHSENYFKGLDEKLDINLNVDVQPQGAVTDEVAMNAKSVSSQEKSPDIAVNSGRKEQKSTTPAESMYYFREAVVQPNGIESSKSDKELLSKALTSPDDLTYEELLYTASLTDVPEEKLAIYNIAFVHVDRDWRAFNNAAVSAIQSSDLSTANLYLYQASLLSSDNGQIKNNMGILACYENKLDKAKGFFVAASKLGYDAQYNLQLVNNLNKPSRPGDINGQQGDKDNNVIVDIIDYKATEK